MMITPRRNTNSVKNAIAPKISPVMPPSAILDFNPIKEIINIANQIAPEHLEIFGYEEIKLETKIDNAGAIFIGKNSPEVFGDYCAGPNHVLPTSGSAKYASPLGVYDFLKRTSLMKISTAHSRELSSTASLLADCEGLTAHSQSAKLRK